MGKTNYELTLERMPAEFLKYDQRRMIDGFHLEHDAAYLYLPFLARRYRVGRQSGVIEWTENGTDYFPGGFEDSMTVYDLLCCAKEGRSLSGRFCRAENLPGAAYGADPAKGMMDPFAALCDRAPEKLARACRELGGVDMGM